MPRIPTEYLNCVVYLYPGEDEARKGVAAGGSGFLIGVRHSPEATESLYVVTNSHVIKEAASKALRFNTLTSELGILAIANWNWTHHPDGDDIAIAPFPFLEHHNRAFVPSEMFVTPKFIQEYGVSPGMETFMMGRLIRLDGQLKNNPSVRFGHLAMLLQSVIHPRGIRQESFIVEMMSLGGYSGSPVFIYENQTTFPGDASLRFFGPRLLGINWGHHPFELEIYKLTPFGREQTDYCVDSNSGMANVAPAWKIMEVIEEHVRLKRSPS